MDNCESGRRQQGHKKDKMQKKERSKKKWKGLHLSKKRREHFIFLRAAISFVLAIGYTFDYTFMEGISKQPSEAGDPYAHFQDEKTEAYKFKFLV